MIEHHGSQDRRAWGHHRRSHQPTIYLRIPTIPTFALPTIYLSVTKPLEPPSTQRHHNFTSDHQGTSAPPYPARDVDLKSRRLWVSRTFENETLQIRMRSSTLLSHFSTWLICPEPASQNHFSRFSDWIRKVQKPVNLVDLVKSFQTSASMYYLVCTI